MPHSTRAKAKTQNADRLVTADQRDVSCDLSRCIEEKTETDRQHIALLEAKLDDTTDLLHMWMNETYAYRFLAEAVATGRYSKEQAKRALKTGQLEFENLHLTYLPLTKEEHKAFTHIATFAQLEPYQFLWSCLDTIMSHADDELLLAGCRESATKRFEEGVTPGWAK